MFENSPPRSKDANSIKLLLSRTCNSLQNCKNGNLDSSGNNLAGLVSSIMDSFKHEFDNRDQQDDKSAIDSAFGESELISKPENSFLHTETMLNPVKQEAEDPGSDLSSDLYTDPILVWKSEELPSVKNSDLSDPLLKYEELPSVMKSDLSHIIKQEPEETVHDDMFSSNNCSDRFEHKHGYTKILKKDIEDIASNEDFPLSSELPSFSKSIWTENDSSDLIPNKNQSVQSLLVSSGMHSPTGKKRQQKSDPVMTACRYYVNDLSYNHENCEKAQKRPITIAGLFKCIPNVHKTQCTERKQLKTKTLKKSLQKTKVTHRQNEEQNRPCLDLSENVTIADRMVTATDLINAESSSALYGVIPLPASISDSDSFFGVTAMVKPKLKCMNKNRNQALAVRKMHTMQGKQSTTKALDNSLPIINVVSENEKQNISCSKSSKNMAVADKLATAMRQENDSALKGVKPILTSICNKDPIFDVTTLAKRRRNYAYKNRDQMHSAKKEHLRNRKKRQTVSTIEHEDLETGFALLEGVIPLPESIIKPKRGPAFLTEEEKQNRRAFKKQLQCASLASKTSDSLAEPTGSNIESVDLIDSYFRDFSGEGESSCSSNEDEKEEIFESIEDLSTGSSESKEKSWKPAVKDGSLFSLELIAEILQTTVDQLDSEQWRKHIAEVEDRKLFRKLVSLGKGLRRYKCHICGIQVHGTSKNVETHMREIHNAPLGFGCFICPLARPTEKHLVLHEKVHTFWHRKGICTICDIVHLPTTNINWSSLHTKCHPPLSEVRLLNPDDQVKVHKYCNASNCSATAKLFVDAFSLSTHAVANHFGNFETCDICGKGGMSLQGLKRHRRICFVIKEEKPRVCEMCGKIGKKLIRHDCSGKFDCKLCGAKFTNYYGKRSHTMRVHTGKEHIRNLCGEDFSERAVLEDHMGKHTSARPCEYTAYGGRYTSKLSLAMHGKLQPNPPKKQKLKISTTSVSS